MSSAIKESKETSIYLHWCLHWNQYTFLNLDFIIILCWTLNERFCSFTCCYLYLINFIDFIPAKRTKIHFFNLLFIFPSNFIDSFLLAQVSANFSYVRVIELRSQVSQGISLNFVDMRDYWYFSVATVILFCFIIIFISKSKQQINSHKHKMRSMKKITNMYKRIQ